MIEPTKFELSDSQLGRVREGLRSELRQGLRLANQEVAVLPTYLSPAEKQTEGRCLVIDCGGTNIRAAVVEFDSKGGFHISAGPVEAPVPPSDENTPVSVFLAQHVELVRRLGDVSGLPLGYCFSYPSQNTEAGDAVLLKWTKGLQFKNAIGSLIGEKLCDALQAAGISVPKIKVLNDTVAALFASPVNAESCSIGLIVGTGFNIAAFARGEQVSKCPSWPGDLQMAVNLESGNFSPPELLSVDDELDTRSRNPNEQKYEKAVSGLYLPQIFRLCCPDLEPDHSAAYLVRLRDSSSDTIAGKYAGAILKRSAELVASGLAGVVDVFAKPSLDAEMMVNISAEGSLFWGDPQYAEQVRNRLESMLGQGYSLNIHKTESANLIGAARAVLA